MWRYEKRLQYPVNIKRPDARMAKVIISQMGGPDGELGASLRYLSQRFSMPYPELKGVLTDIGTEAARWPRLSRLFPPGCRRSGPCRRRSACLSGRAALRHAR